MDKTVFPDPETIRNELKKAPAFADRGKSPRTFFANRLKNGSLILPSESEHLYLKALVET